MNNALCVVQSFTHTKKNDTNAIRFVQEQWCSHRFDDVSWLEYKNFLSSTYTSSWPSNDKARWLLKITGKSLMPSILLLYVQKFKATQSIGEDKTNATHRHEDLRTHPLLLSMRCCWESPQQTTFHECNAANTITSKQIQYFLENFSTI